MNFRLAAVSCGQPRFRWVGRGDSGFGVLWVKTLYRPQLMPEMVTLLVVAPLLRGIVVEPITSRVVASPIRLVSVCLFFVIG